MTSKPQVSYVTEVRSFGHSGLATHPAYARLRQALSDLANEIATEGDADLSLAGWLEAVRDMALTAPYGDMCNACSKHCAATHRHDEQGDCLEGCGAETWWPHALTRAGNWVTGTYTCTSGHSWTCGYAVDIMRYL